MEILCSKEEYKELYRKNPSLSAVARILSVSPKKIKNDFDKLGIEYEHSNINTVYRIKHGINLENDSGENSSATVSSGYNPGLLEIIERRVYDEKTVTELFDSVENYQSTHNGQSRVCRLVEVKYNDDYVVIVFLADLHIGAEGTELRLMRRHLDEIRSRRNLLLALCGDYEDNFITFAQNQQLIPPSDQHRLVEYIINSIRDKTIGCLRGNHEERTKKIADVDLVERYCGQANIPYLGAQGWIKITVRDIEYKIFMAHSGRFESSFNKTHAVKRAFEQNGEFDIGVIAHKHSGSIEQTEIWGVQRILIRPGTYMVYHRWSINEGYGESNVCVPAVLLSGKSRQMIPFYNLGDALKILDLLQKEKNGE